MELRETIYILKPIPDFELTELNSFCADKETCQSLITRRLLIPYHVSYLPIIYIHRVSGIIDTQEKERQKTFPENTFDKRARITNRCVIDN